MYSRGCQLDNNGPYTYRIFQNGLNSVNLRSELVEISKIGLILHMSATLQTHKIEAILEIIELTPTNVRPSFVI